MSAAPDPVELTAALIRCPSVTPEEGGAIRLLEQVLAPMGFACRRADRGGIANLYARCGTVGPVFGFNGHTDVVPVGAGWSVEPFGAERRDGVLYGRGACDMKSGVAAFVAAAAGFVRDRPDFPGSIAILVTGDEEGDGVDGTAAILDWMDAQGESLDVCVVGEPTCPDAMGEMMKIGRRGSLTAYFTASGVQGHSAYPHRARNPIPPLVALLHRLAQWRLDAGTEHFEPSTLAITGVDVGNPANNVIPAQARAMVNIRFNDAHDSAGLLETLRAMAAEAAQGTGVEIALEAKVSGESFLTEPGPFSALLSQAVEAETGRRPVLSTSGGTSDARFIAGRCPVVELGLVGRSMHQADEHVRMDDIRALARIYRRALDAYFSA